MGFIANWRQAGVGKAYTQEIADKLGVRQAYVFDALKQAFGGQMFMIMAGFKEASTGGQIHGIDADLIPLREPLLDGFARLNNRLGGAPDFDSAFEKVLQLDMALSKIEDMNKG